MNNSRLFLDYLRKFTNITEEEYKQLILPYIVIRKFGKRAVVLKAEEVDNHFNFILHGLARMYCKKGKDEINIQISFENHFIHAQDSFFNCTPSKYSIETIEPTTFVSITRENLDKIYNSSKKMEQVGRLIMTNALIIKDRWQMQLVLHSPRDRFIRFVTKNPELLQRVPQKFLASFLNIKPETFSRFKHLLRKRT